MHKLKDFLTTEDISIEDAMKKINLNATGNLFICRDGVLVASISDGDIRRAIINGASLKENALPYANSAPIYLPGSKKAYAEQVMIEKSITAIPIVDENKKIIDIRFMLKGDISKSENVNVPIVIMAGGKGTRLKPFTDILPKPLIPIGDKTITEHILDKFSSLGCEEFYMIVNYKKEFIKAYFADDDRNQIIPKFVDEIQFLGTGGGLALLKKYIGSTFFLTNCDILIEMDYSDALKYHKESGNIITLICAKKIITIPYGTIETDNNGFITRLVEKPSYQFQTNTGFYIIEPEFMDLIPENTKIDMTDIIDSCITNGQKVGAYLVDETDWMDMGQFEEMDKMKEKMGIK